VTRFKGNFEKCGGVKNWALFYKKKGGLKIEVFKKMSIVKFVLLIQYFLKKIDVKQIKRFLT
jgi:hypothetical protein